MTAGPPGMHAIPTGGSSQRANRDGSTGAVGPSGAAAAAPLSAALEAAGAGGFAARGAGSPCAFEVVGSAEEGGAAVLQPKHSAASAARRGAGPIMAWSRPDVR